MFTASAVQRGSFQREEPISQPALPRDQSFIHSQLWLLCLLMLVRFVLLSQHPTYTHTHTRTNHQGKKEWKGRVTGWPLIHDSALKTRLSNQIVGLEGPAGPQWCPGPPGVTEQLRGVNVHFSQLSKMCDGGKGKQRSTKVIWCTNIDSLKLISGSRKTLIRMVEITKGPNPKTGCWKNSWMTDLFLSAGRDA